MNKRQRKALTHQLSEFALCDLYNQRNGALPVAKTLRQLGAESQVEGLDGRGELPPTQVRNIHEYLDRRKFWAELANA